MAKDTARPLDAPPDASAQPLVGSGIDVVAVTPEPIPVTETGRAGTRAIAALVDEGISSLQNFAILFAALHYLNVTEIGVFTLSYTSVFLAEMLLKFLLLVPLSVSFAHATVAQQRAAGGRAVGSSVLSGLGLLAASAIGAIAAHGESRALLLTGGFAIVGVIAQEAWRSYFFTIGRPWHAVLNELCCLVATLALVYVYVIRPGDSTPAVLILLLGVGTGVGFAVGCMQTRILPSVLPGGWRWLREHWQSGIRLAGSRGATQIAGRVSLGVISSIAGNAALGQLSASRTLMTPATTLLTSSMSYAVPEATRLHRRGDRRLERFLVTVSVVLGGSVAIVGLGISQLPDHVGRIIAGHNWLLAKELLLPAILYSTANSLQQGANVGLIVHLRPGWTLRISLANSAVVLGGAAAGAALGQAAGAAWGLALAQLASVPMWWIPYRYLVRHSAKAGTASAAAAADTGDPVDAGGRHRVPSQSVNGTGPGVNGATAGAAISPRPVRRTVRASRPDPTWVEIPVPAEPARPDQAVSHPG